MKILISSTRTGIAGLGFGMFVYGVWLAWHPAGYMVAGALLTAVAFLGGYESIRGRR